MAALALPGDAPYFESSLRTHLSQGDIYLAPSATLCEAEGIPTTVLAPALPPAVGQHALIRAWGPGTEASGQPALAVSVAWTPVMVLSHDCEIDKEFNEHIDRYLREHKDATEADAIERFSTRWDLDRHVLVSPLLPIDAEHAPESKHESIRTAQRIGYVPVPALPAYGEADFFLHLSRVSTVERKLLSDKHKLASLSEVARSLLRFKLAEALASRNLNLVSKLEAAIGRSIADVRTLTSGRSTATVALVLNDGAELHVDAKRDRPGPPPTERLRALSDP